MKTQSAVGGRAFWGRITPETAEKPLEGIDLAGASCSFKHFFPPHVHSYFIKRHVTSAGSKIIYVPTDAADAAATVIF